MNIEINPAFIFLVPITVSTIGSAASQQSPKPEDNVPQQMPPPPYSSINSLVPVNEIDPPNYSNSA